MGAKMTAVENDTADSPRSRRVPLRRLRSGTGGNPYQQNRRYQAWIHSAILGLTSEMSAGTSVHCLCVPQSGDRPLLFILWPARGSLENRSEESIARLNSGNSA